MFEHTTILSSLLCDCYKALRFKKKHDTYRIVHFNIVQSIVRLSDINKAMKTKGHEVQKDTHVL